AAAALCRMVAQAGRPALETGRGRARLAIRRPQLRERHPARRGPAPGRPATAAGIDLPRPPARPGYRGHPGAGLPGPAPAGVEERTTTPWLTGRLPMKLWCWARVS